MTPAMTLGAVLRPSARCWRFRSTAAGSVAAGDVGNGARAAGSAPRAPRARTAPKRAIFLRNPQNFEKSSKMSSRNTWYAYCNYPGTRAGGGYLGSKRPPSSSSAVIIDDVMAVLGK